MEKSGGWLMKDKEQELARERALVILRVRSGAMTAKQGAQALGVSRKTYYQWEERALKAMALALENRVAGRPCVSTDEEKETLRQRIGELEKKLTRLSAKKLDLAEKALEVKELLAAYEEFRHGGAKKNRGIGKKR
jgi:transposase